MKVKVKILDKNIETTLPKYSRDGDCALDLVATSVSESFDFIEYGTNIAIKIPEGYVGIIAPRSSISKYDLSLCNSIGVIDQNYVGELKLRFKPNKDYSERRGFPIYYNIGDRIGQLLIVPIPKIELDLVEDLGETNRGSNGFGSSGV